MKPLRFSQSLIFAFGLACAPVLLAGPHLHLAGDSTMADKSTKAPNLERGWGQMLRSYMAEPSALVNHAQNGRSSKSLSLIHI